MKKRITLILSVMLALVMIFCLTGCGAEVTLQSQTANGVTLDVPSDFGAFEISAAHAKSANEQSTGLIVITTCADAQGYTAADFDEDTYIQSQMSTYTDIEFVEFDTDAELEGVPALFSHAYGVGSAGYRLEIFHYMLFFDDGTFQSILISYSTDTNSSLQANIDSVLSSITLE